MANEIQLNVFLTVTNPAGGGAGAFTDQEQPSQLSLTQNAVGVACNIQSIPVAGANTVAQNSIVLPSAACATTTTLPACTYANGASGVGATLTGNANGALGTIDGHATVINEYLLVKNQASALQNGLYQITTIGDGTHQFVLTRPTQQDSTGKYVNTFTYVVNGTVNGSTFWNCTNATAPNVGTDGINYSQSAGGTQISLGNLTTVGWAYLQNLDAGTNYVIYGPGVNGIMQPSERLYASENAVIRLNPGKTWYALAVGGAVNLKSKIFND